MKAIKSEDVPVTLSLLYLFSFLNSSRKSFIDETGFTSSLGEPEPADYDSRCRHLFFFKYAGAAIKLGINLDEVTYRTIMDLPLTSADLLDEMSVSDYNKLPERFVFNPLKGIHRVGQHHEKK
jgi:hypothetical protein